MTTLKQTKSSTALIRVLALPLLVGAVAGCDFASRLPDAPSNLGGYDLSQKPPSVTGPQELNRLPPPPNLIDGDKSADAFAKLKAPVEYRTNNQTAQANDAMAEKPPLASAPKTLETEPFAQTAFTPLEFEALEAPSAQATEVAQNEFVVPPLATEPSQLSYSPNASQEYTPYEAPQEIYTSSKVVNSVPLDTYAIEGTPSQPQARPYASVPIDTYAIGAAPTLTMDPVITVPSAPLAQAQPSSPIAILRARLPNGAVVNVHPIIGAPGGISATLAQTVVSKIGTVIDKRAAANAQIAFDLRGTSERNTDGYVAVEWKLFDSYKNIIGIFPERQNGSGWNGMSDGALRAMGQRVADRIVRNNELRRATLYAQRSSGGNGITVSNSTFVLERGASLASAPMPRVSPRMAVSQISPPATMGYGTSIQPLTQPLPIARPAPRAVAVAAPTQPVLNTAPQQPVRTIAAAQPQPRIMTQAPQALRAPTPIQAAPQVSQIIAQAPQPSAPPPTFDTLRPVSNASAPVSAPIQVASGPRPLVFRGVRGAPGNGDLALGREVGKLLQQSGARMTNDPEPGALFLTAQVSKTAGGNSDRIEIIWQVQDDQGVSVGQVTQANDVPRGALDSDWGQDAYYAAQGARDGIIELLQSSGALDS